MRFFERLSSITVGAAVLTSVGAAQVVNPDATASVVPSPPVAGLTCSIALGKHQASVEFGVGPVPVGSGHAWTFSGCDATPASSTLASPTVVGDTPGIITATVTVTPPPPGQLIGPLNGQAVVIGGPITITSQRTQTREEQTGIFAVSQPWIFEWFGTSYSETPKTLSGALVLTGQPTGTTYGWSPWGQVQFVGGSSGSTCQVQATGTSVRASAGIELTYYYTVAGHQ